MSFSWNSPWFSQGFCPFFRFLNLHPDGHLGLPTLPRCPVSRRSALREPRAVKRQGDRGQKTTRKNLRLSWKQFFMGFLSFLYLVPFLSSSNPGTKTGDHYDLESIITDLALQTSSEKNGKRASMWHALAPCCFSMARELWEVVRRRWKQHVLDAIGVSI